MNADERRYGRVTGPGSRLSGGVERGRLLVVVWLGLALIGLCFAPAVVAQPGPGTSFRCPFHPEVVQDRPGTCPVCGMDLVPAAPEPATLEAITYACPMHPDQRAVGPGVCPICGMELMPAAPELPRVGYEVGEDGVVVVAENALRELLKAALESPDPELRLAAITGIVEPESIRPLLADVDPMVRGMAAVELGLRGDEASREALQRSAVDDEGDWNGGARFAALQALLWLRDEATVGEVRRLMTSEESWIRYQMALVAGSTPELVPDLRRLTEDAEPQVRRVALWSLARLGESDAMAVFALEWSRDSFVIQAALDPEGAPARLREVIAEADGETGCRVDESLMTITEAASVLLERLGDPAGRAALHSLLERCAPAARSGDLETYWLQLVLSALRSSAAREDLAIVAPYLDADDPVIRTYAAAFIARVLFGIGYRIQP